jgi:hypothetical protein
LQSAIDKLKEEYMAGDFKFIRARFAEEYLEDDIQRLLIWGMKEEGHELLGVLFVFSKSKGNIRSVAFGMSVMVLPCGQEYEEDERVERYFSAGEVLLDVDDVWSLFLYHQMRQDGSVEEDILEENREFIKQVVRRFGREDLFKKYDFSKGRWDDELVENWLSYIEDSLLF